LDTVDLILAKAQIRITTITLVGFLVTVVALLAIFFWPNLKPSQDLVALVSGAFGVLGTILTQQNGFFFARHRQLPAAPDPSPNPTQPPPAVTSTGAKSP
jgi:hypothetical protein